MTAIKRIAGMNPLAAGVLAVALIAAPCYAATGSAAITTNTTSASSASPEQPSADTSIRPFRIDVPQAELDDLRARVRATRWPDKETVDDQSQGVQLAKIQLTRALLGHGLRLAQGRGEAQRAAAVRDRGSTGSTSTSSTFAPRIRTRCR